MKSTAEKMRGWDGPAVFSFGFRPFFLLAGLWATLAMGLWVAMLTGTELLPTAFDPVAWHAHEFVFGYVSAVMAGFLLTAVPNWTGQLPVVGWPLAALASLWLLGRIAVALSNALPWGLSLTADLSFLGALCLLLAREILKGRNWRNLPVLAILAVFILANVLFHIERSADGYGLRLGLAAALMLITLIGGRIIPSFTRNWLAAQNANKRPVAFSPGDKWVVGQTGLALIGFVVWPQAPFTGILCAVAGMANLWRLSRWQGFACRAEPLLWVLHLAYGLLGLGFLAVAGAGFDLAPQAAARHIWLAGTIGLMTLAVMTRASLGHAGRSLHAGPGITGLYLALCTATLARFLAGFFPAQDWLLHLAALGWIGSFGGFSVIYWPVLTKPRHKPKQRSPAPNT